MTGVYRSLLCVQLFVATSFCLNACQTYGKQPVQEFCSENTLRNIASIYMYSPTTDTHVTCVCNVTMSNATAGVVKLDYVTRNNELNINVTYDNETLHADDKKDITLDSDRVVVIRLQTYQESNDSLICVGVKAENILKPIDVVCYNASTDVTSTVQTSTQESSRQETTPQSTTVSATQTMPSSKVSSAESTPSTAWFISTPSPTANLSNSQSTPTASGTTATNNTTSMGANMQTSRAGSKLNIGIVIAIAAGGFVILVTIVTVILCTLRKQKDEEDANAREPDIYLTENPLYCSPSVDYRGVDDSGDKGTPVNDVSNANLDEDTNTIQANVDIQHDELDYAQVVKKKH